MILTINRSPANHPFTRDLEMKMPRRRRRMQQKPVHPAQPHHSHSRTVCSRPVGSPPTARSPSPRKQQRRRTAAAAVGRHQRLGCTDRLGPSTPTGWQPASSSATLPRAPSGNDTLAARPHARARQPALPARLHACAPAGQHGSGGPTGGPPDPSRQSAAPAGAAGPDPLWAVRRRLVSSTRRSVSSSISSKQRRSVETPLLSSASSASHASQAGLLVPRTPPAQHVNSALMLHSSDGWIESKQR
jgi:hypothetical protein